MNFLTRAMVPALLIGGTLLAAGGAYAQAKPVCGLNNGKPATGEPIPIGAVVGKTGPDDFSASALAAQAYFKCVNANGGIHGRPIDYTILDDQWNPEIAAQVAAKLVKDRRVVAMVGNSSFVECGVNGKMYAQDDVMVIAGVGVPRECFFAKNYAPVNAAPRACSGRDAHGAGLQGEEDGLRDTQHPQPGNGPATVSRNGAANGVDVEVITIDPITGRDSTMLQQPR
jgi:branched-chain amino acid transport system substrate-binding protein